MNEKTKPGAFRSFDVNEKTKPGAFRSFDVNETIKPGAFRSFETNEKSKPGAFWSFDVNEKNKLGASACLRRTRRASRELRGVRDELLAARTAYVDVHRRLRPGGIKDAELRERSERAGGGGGSSSPKAKLRGAKALSIHHIF